MTNAVKFTRKGTITTSCKVNPVEGSEDLILQVVVKDEGIGMSDEDQNRVFEGFLKTSNIESRNMNPYGNGIGLSLCKKICQGLGGDITVDSVLGIGSTFKFTMKAKKVYN